MLPPATQLGESPIATPLPVASAGNNHVAISLSSLDRAFPDQALRQILSRSPVLKTVLNDCALTVEHELLQIKVPFAVRASVETDPEEGRTRYVLRVIAPNLDFRSKMDLWTRIADELRLARKQAMTEIRPPRLAAREAWSDVMIHFDLD